MEVIKFLSRHLTKNNSTLIILLFCLSTRLFSTIYYFEDIDSLRFAMAAYEFDVLNSRPHFPGYPIFCFFSQLILLITNNLALTFSLIGGISTFIIIYFCDKIWRLYFNKQNLFFLTILFFNPFMWLMSNRYMPDLFALSLLVTGVYYLIKILKKSSLNDHVLLGIIISILFGVRVSFIPFFIPIIFLISKKNFKFFCLSFLATTIIWVTPFIYMTGIYEIIELFKGINHVAKILKVSNADGGYRTLTNIGSNGGQEVPHLHFHIFGGEKIGKMVS